MLDPVFEIVKRLAISDTIDEDDSSSPFVICLSDGLESFLPCCIPDLHFDFDAIDIDGFDFEVDSDSGDMRHLVLFVDVSEEYVGFANCGIANDDQFHQIVVFLFVSSLCHNNYKLTEL